MSRIISTGSYLPPFVLDNDDFVRETAIDSSDEWIYQRTGIKQRHFAKEESLSTLATKAAEAALATLTENERDRVRLIILATMSSYLPTPAIANQVQKNLGIGQAWSFDISGACAGFVMALETAEKISRDYEDGYTLVIGAEKMSDTLDFSDRSTSVLFGDGAAAVLIEHDGKGLAGYASALQSIPDDKSSITVDTANQAQAKIQMQGREVFNFVVRQVIPTLKTFVEEEVGDFDYLISHQANARLIDMMVKKLKLPADQAPINIDQVANTSAASIPILLDQMVEAGRIPLDGSQTVVISGFGGGLSWGHIALKL